MKSGMSSAIFASPLSSSFTGPLNRATVRVGTTSRPPMSPESPPVRMRPRSSALAVEQAAVVVAHGEAELALAEVVVGRLGRLEARELQDAFVDGGEGDVTPRSSCGVGDLDRHLDALARRHLLGRARSALPSVRRAGSMPSQAAPMARVGVRSAGVESGRQAVTSA